MKLPPAQAADLHLHSSYSDGTFSPQEVVARAAGQSLSPIALTDHDTVAGIPEALQAGTELKVEVIPGIELSAHEPEQEFHLLGYFIRWEDPSLTRTLEGLEARRRSRLEEIVRRLERLGVHLELNEVLRIAGQGTVGRLHVARALLMQRVVGSVGEAFDRFLGQDRPAYVRQAPFSLSQAITVIREAEGIAVLAHPGRSGLDTLTYLIDAGLQGIEVFHPSHSTEEVYLLARAASEHGLLITGGSDCHGRAQGEPRLGQIRLPMTYVERLRQAVSPAHPTPDT